MVPLDICEESEACKKKVAAFLNGLQDIDFSVPDELIDAASKLHAIRNCFYEDLNQIQHEIANLRAAKVLLRRDPALSRASWYWNPRQTGSALEPDIRVLDDNRVVVSAEVTTSSKPQGGIDTTMAKVLAQLEQMDGEKYYFVVTREMQKRAETKISKKYAGKTTVVNLNHCGQS